MRLRRSTRNGSPPHLRERAATRGLSLSQYALEILREHCHQTSTVDERLDGPDRLTPVPLSTSAAEAVRESREATEAALDEVMPDFRRQRPQELVENFGTLGGFMASEELRRMR
jgi:hypothetical protein